MAPYLCILLFLCAGGCARADSLLGASMVFLENATDNFSDAPIMHESQVQIASHYALAIIGWGEDSAEDGDPSYCVAQEEKLANISKVIKARSPTTRTAAYAGQVRNKRAAMPHETIDL